MSVSFQPGAQQGIGAVVDFNIHDLAGIRLINPAPGDVQLIARHLGMSPAPFSGTPAITIKFVERLAADEPLRFLGRDDVGFTDNDFVILRSRNLARARTRLEMESVGETCELTCETGLPAIPLLRQLINLVMLARGVLPVHAAAFRYRERGVMVTGWSHGSKTGTLLAFMAAGAQFVGDEWIYIDPASGQMHGLPDQLEARPWYLNELRQYRSRVGIADRLRVGLTGGAARLLGPIIDRSERRNSLGSKLVRSARQSLLDQQSIHLKPTELFGEDQSILRSSLDVVVVAVSHASNDIAVEPIGREKAIGQMAASFLYEQASLTAAYHKHLFAFANRRNPLLDRLEQAYKDRASKALGDSAAYSMRHPYPVSTRRLHHAVLPLIEPSN